MANKLSSFQFAGFLLLRTVLITLALLLFFSMMAGMYYKSEPRGVRVAICDLDHSPLSRSVIYSINASEMYEIKESVNDYQEIQDLIDKGKIDLGIVIPENAYKNVLNHRPVRVLAAVNGTANPIVPKLSVGTLKKILMTLNMQLMMHMPIEDLGSIPNVRHAKEPLLGVSQRVYYSPAMNMESSMLPAFMGLAMQIVSMLIILLALKTNLKQVKGLIPQIKYARQMPLKAILAPAIMSWIMVGTAISTAFFTTMYIFGVPLPQNIWNTVLIIFLLVLAMESLSIFLTLNINNVIILTALITLIVLPAFMYSGFLIPEEQMAYFPHLVGGLFPLRYYLRALYLVFNHHMPLSVAAVHINTLLEFIAAFITLVIVSIAIGIFERRRIHLREKLKKMETEVVAEENA